MRTRTHLAPADEPGRGGIAIGAPLALLSVVSVQLGAALATRLFPLVGPIGAVGLRFLGAAVALVAFTRPWRREWHRAELLSSAVLGLVLASMNLCLYAAISRLPLATGITLEYLGPLTLTLVTSSSWRQRVWAAPTAAGVLLLGGSLKVDDIPGVLFALGAAACWAAYIVLNQRMARSGHGLAGLGLATTFGALVTVPAGVAAAGSALWHPSTLLLGLAVGVLSSALAYSLDLEALRRLPTAVFGVLTSLNPAAAAVAGLVLLGQPLPAVCLGGIALVIVASVGMTLARPEPGGRRNGQPGGGRSDRGKAPAVSSRTSPGDLQPTRPRTSTVSGGPSKTTSPSRSATQRSTRETYSS